MFVGRTQELNKLNHMYKSDNFEFAVFYGRRRVGKTTLINEFCKDKKTIYFMGIESTEKENLKNFSQAVFQVTEKPKELPAFDSFQNLMNYVGSVAESERLVLVIDEYPYLAQSNQAISSILQELRDEIIQAEEGLEEDEPDHRYGDRALHEARS
ncbi:MAG: AAA family ATPase [Methanosarcinaceae archaeon]|nr:AAA family ATPase [Methanosarcinaceae archaeon]